MRKDQLCGYRETPNDQCDNGGKEKRSDSGHILKVKSTGFADELDVWVRSKEREG